MSFMVYDDICEICRNRSELITWLQEKELIGSFTGKRCDRCSCGYFNLITDHSYKYDKLVYRCSGRNCRFRKSIRHNSWFAGSHLKLEQIVKLTYYWVNKLPQEFVQRELRIGSRKTLIEWYNFAREVCVKIIQRESEIIGGNGVVVEIDETIFRHKKYNKNKKREDDYWVFGGIERQGKKCFLEVVEDRSASTLVAIIKKYIEPGSIIHSDCSKAYASLEEKGYTHLAFSDSESRTSKQTIESTWLALKRSLPKQEFYESYFVEYIFRKKYLKSESDKFQTFLEKLKIVYNPNEEEEEEEEEREENGENKIENRTETKD